jgi:hypothetical protein
MKNIGIYKDSLINANYMLVIFDSAKELSEKLRADYKKNGVDYNIFNSDLDNTTRYRSDEDEVKITVKTPPQEIYEYQNFFLMDKGNDQYVLLDGFRRLIYYNAPDVPVYARIYNQKDLNDQQILSVLVYLNHFKFFGGGSYQDRGFGLLLNSVFGLSINKYREALDGYLLKNETTMGYSGEWGLTSTKKNISVKKRILNPLFASDIKFIEALHDGGAMVNTFLGTLVFSVRANSTKPLDPIVFLKIQDDNKVLKDLLVRYYASGSGADERKRKLVNQIIEMYQNIFTLMEGGDVEKSYAELLKDARGLVADLKKDKTLIKLTGRKNMYDIDKYMQSLIKSGKPLKFKMVVYPNKDDNHEAKVPSGVYEEITFKKFYQYNSLYSQEMMFIFTHNKHVFDVEHNRSSGYGHGYSKEYTKIRFQNGSGFKYLSYDVEVFIEMNEKDVPDRFAK